jgi:5-methyltetrahydropteroyltriglutamate--homocysteine methyltransferase
MATRYRAEQVGSFLRTPEVLEAHQAQARGEISLEQLRLIEDQAILDCLKMQQETGIDIYSDGELRRTSWASDFTDAVEGYVPGRPAVSVRFSGPMGEGQAGAMVLQATPGVATSAPGGGMGRVIGEKLRPVRRLTGHEAPFLAQHAPGPFKVTMPAPSYVVARAYNPEITSRAYPTRMDVLRDAANIIRAEIETLIAEGVSYIQLDNPHYPDYIVDERRDAWAAIGVDPDQALLEDIEADNICFRGFDHDKVTFGIHFCRGNGGQGGFHTSGSYERIAEACFGRLEADTFLLEYDSERAGGFEPLRFMPRGKTVVLGLVTTKSGELESQDLIERRIEEASRYVDLQDLALSPQCGFASVMQGNPLTFEEQRAKLELVVRTARKVWGGQR